MSDWNGNVDVRTTNQLADADLKAYKWKLRTRFLVRVHPSGQTYLVRDGR